eukprot:2905589-Pyramimonas_sp.AAC.1
MPAARSVAGSPAHPPPDVDMVTVPEATPADDVPTSVQRLDKVRVLPWNECCERSCHEEPSRFTMFDNACTPREYKLRAQQPDEHYRVPPPLRGTSAPGGIECTTDQVWAAQLNYDDHVITDAPDLDHSGCSPEYKWISLPPYNDMAYGPELILIEYLGDNKFMSKDISTMLRHASHSKNFSINQLTDRRINLWRRSRMLGGIIPAHGVLSKKWWHGNSATV